MDTQPQSLPLLQLGEEPAPHPEQVPLRVRHEHVVVKVLRVLPPSPALAATSKRLVQKEAEVPAVPEQHGHQGQAEQQQTDDDGDEDAGVSAQETGLSSHVEGGDLCVGDVAAFVGASGFAEE